MLFISFVLPIIVALEIIFIYIWRIRYRQAKRYPLLFKIFYSLAILAGTVISIVQLVSTLNLGWGLFTPWFLLVSLGSIALLGFMAVDLLRPIRSIYMAYLIPLFAILFAGVSAVKPNGKGTAILLAVFGASVLWVYLVRQVSHKTRGLNRWTGLAGLHLIPIVVPVLWLGYASQQSRLPASVSMNMSSADMAAMHQQGTMQEVSDLRGPASAEHVKKFAIEATEAALKLSSGKTVNAWVYRTNDAPSMPVLRVTQGDLVEATVTNHLSVPVTIHWHGVNVPNGEDGVAGVTQDAIKPGGQFTYRFIAKDEGSYWFHSHQDSNFQVSKGLFGALIVEPVHATDTTGIDIPIIAHTWQNNSEKQFALGTNDTVKQRAITPGTPVRLRLINTDNNPRRLQIVGTDYKIISLDGVDLTEPATISNQTISVPSGGRIDASFAMPATAVELVPIGGGSASKNAGLLMSPSGKDRPKAPAKHAKTFDMATYGQAHSGAIQPTAKFDKTYSLTLDGSFRFFNGQLRFTFPINGRLFPDTPMLMVHEGDLVKVSFKNRSPQNHPIHLHGHHFTILEHDGQAVASRPILDTIDIAPGESWVIAFRADNPGLWMSHCHNLSHASAGMDLMVAYDTVMTPFTINWAGGNKPE